MTLEDLFKSTAEANPDCDKDSFYLGAAAMYALLTSAKSEAETFERMQDAWAEIQEHIQETYRGGDGS